MTTYTTAANVASLLRLYDPATGARKILGVATDPLLAEVNRWINEAEDHIDQMTKRSWRESEVENEYHDIRDDWRLMRWTRPRIFEVHTRYRPVKTLDTTQGDLVEVWDGANWVDLITTRTEGRADDFWVNYEDGVIYIRRPRVREGPSMIRLTYRYGYDTVPLDIQEAATKYAALKVIESDLYNLSLPQGDLYDPRPKILDQWRRDIDMILSRHAAWTIV